MWWKIFAFKLNIMLLFVRYKDIQYLEQHVRIKCKSLFLLLSWYAAPLQASGDKKEIGMCLR